MKFGEKTNKKWYPSDEMGCWYKLENGNMLFAPMLENGRIEMDCKKCKTVNSGDVDWYFMEEKYKGTVLEFAYQLCLRE